MDIYKDEVLNEVVSFRPTAIITKCILQEHEQEGNANVSQTIRVLVVEALRNRGHDL